MYQTTLTALSADIVFDSPSTREEFAACNAESDRLKAARAPLNEQLRVEYQATLAATDDATKLACLHRVRAIVSRLVESCGSDWLAKLPDDLSMCDAELNIVRAYLEQSNLKSWDSLAL